MSDSRVPLTSSMPALDFDADSWWSLPLIQFDEEGPADHRSLNLLIEGQTHCATIWLGASAHEDPPLVIFIEQLDTLSPEDLHEVITALAHVSAVVDEITAHPRE